MNIIFNKDGAGDQEMKKHLGFIDKSIGYANLDRFIRNACLTLIEIIGQPTYEAIYAMYDAGNPSATDQGYITMLQDAIAIEAYRRYVPSKDVGHTQNGRRMRMDEHEKQAFEWMIDRDNSNMERMFYLSVDQLLNELETLESWKSSDAYKKLNALFVSKTSDVQEWFDISNSRYLLLKLTPGLRQAERRAILPRIGKEMMETLKAAPQDHEDLYTLIKEACVYWALSWAMKGRLTVTLFPEGVLQRFVSDRTTTQGKKPPLQNEYAWAAQEFMRDAEDILIKIEEIVAEPVQEAEEPTTAQTDTEKYGFNEDDNFITT
tara:strand:- start:3301 stop:4257 length:957 start_codon:yes stop_codon:yes gene_type:complete